MLTNLFTTSDGVIPKEICTFKSDFKKGAFPGEPKNLAELDIQNTSKKRKPNLYSKP